MAIPLSIAIEPMSYFRYKMCTVQDPGIGDGGERAHSDKVSPMY